MRRKNIDNLKLQIKVKKWCVGKKISFREFSEYALRCCSLQLFFLVNFCMQKAYFECKKAFFFNFPPLVGS